MTSGECLAESDIVDYTSNDFSFLKYVMCLEHYFTTCQLPLITSVNGLTRKEYVTCEGSD